MADMDEAGKRCGRKWLNHYDRVLLLRMKIYMGLLSGIEILHPARSSRENSPIL